MRVPYHQLESLFFDIGNTLISMDFEKVRGELAALGVSCRVASLRRAEAAVRPQVSAALAGPRSTEDLPFFELYLRSMLLYLAKTGELETQRVEGLARELVSPLKALGPPRLWSYVLPGVREALAGLRALGYTMVVVSNSDGTAEEVLETQGLRGYFDDVLDSHIVGIEKPDPEIFHRALERAGARAETTLHVGDLYAADVVGARAAGLHALLLDPFEDWTEVDCARLPDVASLHDALQKTSRGRTGEVSRGDIAP